MHAFEAVSVTKSFAGVRAVRGVSMHLGAGELLAVIGPNGAGKSTLFGVIAGEHQVTEGRTILLGRDVTGWPPSKLAHHGVSRAFQVARIFSTRTVEENIHLAVLAGRNRAMRAFGRFGADPQVRRTTQQVLESSSLGRIRDQVAASLSQGDRKQLEIMMAVAQEPRVLLLDEPTAGMSLEDAMRTVDLVRNIRSAHPEMSVLLTAHDMDVIFALAQRVLLMAEGVVRVEGTPTEVGRHPLTREIYLGSEVLS